MRLLIFFTVASALALAPAHAQITMDQIVLGSAGGAMSGGTMRMELTIGQTVNGMIGSGLTSSQLGFWWQVSNVPTAVETAESPVGFALGQNAPNPFALRTSITFSVPHGPTPVTIAIFDIQGRLVRTLVRETKMPGVHLAPWDGCDDSGRPVASGVYYAKFVAGTFHETRKLVLLK